MQTFFDLALNDDEVAVELPLTLQSSPRHHRNMMLAIFTFAILSALMYLLIPHWGWLAGGAAFLPLAALASWGNRTPPQIRLDETGFQLTGGRKRIQRATRWKEIEHIGVIRLGMGQAYVCYQHTKDSGKSRPPGGLMLPCIFTLPSEELAALMEALRQAAGDDAAFHTQDGTPAA
ncbi:hypothetical protein [Chromobacterium vaccinii]|uniref:hypothetical protein n=1 Tax=Chromobacterium piscinae TaxID=686831 RepID=UPI001C8CD8AC|nr:hypothetical protein [Chromobacterium vaccinii]MBX9355199.1 hypothetical protein [Chromobacterium vaccinii]